LFNPPPVLPLAGERKCIFLLSSYGEEARRWGIKIV